MSNPSDQIAAEYNMRRVWMFEKVVGERDVITHVKCSLHMDEIPLLEAVAELPPPDSAAFEEYWRDTDNPLWAEMQDPSGFERPEYIMRDKLAPWAWSVLDKEALEAEGLAKWRAILAAREAARKPSAEERLAALEATLAKQPEPAPPIALSEQADALADPVGPLEALKAKIDAVRAGTQELTPDELISMHRDDPPGAAAKLEDAIRALKGDARRKLSELLNVELAELKNLRGMAGEDREREQQIEYLLGLFTRLGEI